jgi:hypothetical protein
VKSEAQHLAEAELATATAIADACHPDRIPADVQMSQARALVAVGWGLLNLADELRRTRTEIVLIKCQCGGVTPGHPAQTHVIIL